MDPTVKFPKNTIGSRSLMESLQFMEELRDAGYAIVPIRPTAAMIEAGVQVSKMNASTIKVVYNAMLSAGAEE